MTQQSTKTPTQSAKEFLLNDCEGPYADDLTHEVIIGFEKDIPWPQPDLGALNYLYEYGHVVTPIKIQRKKLKNDHLTYQVKWQDVYDAYRKWCAATGSLYLTTKDLLALIQETFPNVRTEILWEDFPQLDNDGKNIIEKGNLKTYKKRFNYLINIRLKK